MGLASDKGGSSIPLPSLEYPALILVHLGFGWQEVKLSLKTSTSTPQRSLRCFGKELNECGNLNPKLLQYRFLAQDEIDGTLVQRNDVHFKFWFNSQFQSLVPTRSLSSIYISLHTSSVSAPRKRIVAVSVSRNGSSVPWYNLPGIIFLNCLKLVLCRLTVSENSSPGG